MQQPANASEHPFVFEAFKQELYMHLRYKLTERLWIKVLCVFSPMLSMRFEGSKSDYGNLSGRTPCADVSNLGL